MLSCLHNIHPGDRLYCKSGITIVASSEPYEMDGYLVVLASYGTQSPTQWVIHYINGGNYIKWIVKGE